MNRAVKHMTLAMVAAACVSCSTSPKQEHVLLSTVRQLGSDLPVRRSELIARCFLKDVPSFRLPMGLRGGWGGTFEEWELPDGGKLIARFNSYAGGFKIVVTELDNLLKADGRYPFPEGFAQIPAPTWFNELVLVDHEEHVLYSNEKRPPLRERNGRISLPGSDSSL